MLEWYYLPYAICFVVGIVVGILIKFQKLSER